MAERLNVSVSVNVTDAADNSEFVSSVVKYAGIPYEFFVAMEADVMRTLASWGQAQVQDRKEKGKDKK